MGYSRHVLLQCGPYCENLKKRYKPERGVTVISSNDVGWRFFFAFCSGTLSMIVVASLSMMISSFVNNAIGPIVGTISIIIGLNIIFTLGAPLFKDVIPYIFTSHFIKWQYFFDFEIETEKLKFPS